MLSRAISALFLSILIQIGKKKKHSRSNFFFFFLGGACCAPSKSATANQMHRIHALFEMKYDAFYITYGKDKNSQW